MDPAITKSPMNDDEDADDTSQAPEIRVEFKLEGKLTCIIIREGETIVKCDDSIRPLLRESVLKCFQCL